MSTHTPVTPDHLGKMVEFSNNEHNWFPQELAYILPERDRLGAAYIGTDSLGIYSLWRHARTAKEPSYLERQEASGLKPGDWVKVNRGATGGDLGWEGTWDHRMLPFIGSILQIGECYDECGFRLKGTNYCFPYFVLEKVDCRPTAEHDLGRVVQYNGQSCILEALFTPRFDDASRAVIDDGTGLKIVLQSEVYVPLEGQA